MNLNCNFVAKFSLNFSEYGKAGYGKRKTFDS